MMVFTQRGRELANLLLLPLSGAKEVAGDPHSVLKQATRSFKHLPAAATDRTPYCGTETRSTQCTYIPAVHISLHI
jgi:hypothetical protein